MSQNCCTDGVDGQQIFKVGIIGGTGLEDPRIMERAAEMGAVDTPFGTPSDSLIEGIVAGVPCVLLSRHGRAHHVSPTNVNYRANIWALKRAGCAVIIASTACGSLREDMAPGDIVLLDSFIDRTTKREQTFYDGAPGHPIGICHIPMYPTFSERLRALLSRVARTAGAAPDDAMVVHPTGTLVCVEGPRFSTRAESAMFRQWGASVVGMTTCPEAVLAKELGIPYASLAVVTDYDCWRDTDEMVSIEQVYKTMQANAERLKRLFVAAIQAIGERSDEFVAEAREAKKLAATSVMDGGQVLDHSHLS